MTAYLGDKAVGVNTVVEKEVAKTKYGLSIDNFLGDVVDGTLSAAKGGAIVLDLTGITTIGSSALGYKFYRTNADVTVIAPNVTEVRDSGFESAFLGAASYTARFDNLESITAAYAFKDSFAGGVYTNPVFDVVFPRLKRINANYAFHGCFDGDVDLGNIFPALEEIQGGMIFSSFLTEYSHTLAKVKKIVGPTSKTSAPLRMSYSGTVHISLPSATELSGYVCYTTSSAKCALHFAAANQAVIEACTGYSYKFGATEIYFDL